MGKQIRFYMADQDENEFLEFVQSTGDVVVLAQTTDKKDGEVFSSFQELAGRRLGDGSHLWNRSISPKPIIRYYDVHGGCFCLDFMQSEVVNMIRSQRIDGKLSVGRLHVENTFLQLDGSVVEKEAEFLNWFDELCRWIRKTFRTTYDGARVSSRADEIAKTGIELIGHRF